MPFGLTNAPAMFQHLMLAELSGEQCLIYLGRHYRIQLNF